MSSKKILLVDDDECLRESFKLILAEAGFDVLEAPDGKNALKILQTHPFDAVILDDNLPFIQGSELLGLIRIQNPQIKIIIMSGLFNAEGIRRIKQQCADLVLEKPFDLNVIIDYLKNQ